MNPSIKGMTFSRIEEIVLEVNTDSRFEDVIKEAKELAKKYNTIVTFHFDGLKVRVNKEDTVDEVMERHEDNRRKLEAWIEHLNNS